MNKYINALAVLINLLDMNVKTFGRNGYYLKYDGGMIQMTKENYKIWEQIIKELKKEGER